MDPSFELLIYGRVADRGTSSLGVMRRHAPEALAGRRAGHPAPSPGERASYLTVDAGVEVISAERLVGVAEAACAGSRSFRACGPQRARLGPEDPLQDCDVGQSEAEQDLTNRLSTGGSCVGTSRRAST